MNFDFFFRILLGLLVLLMGLAAFIGGLKRRPNPFFWLKNYKSTFLKTPTHYVIFGVIAILASLFFFVTLLVKLHV
jgi:uncharacterized membrane protein HdeD (DUF308 family)